ncbi:hypothetical protein GYMLUDRAFT_161396, partial [Collybiopsis luxurians FD-317 M1]
FHILQACYDRFVRPKFSVLKLGTRRGNETYGELTPRLLDCMFKQAGLCSGSWFGDLGSGIGHTVAQAALTYNCHAFGIELGEQIASVAQGMVKEVIAHSKIWGAEIGKMELACGDMCTSSRVQEVVQVADVILANNLKFDCKFNEDIKNLIIRNMKQGSILISLVEFKISGLQNGKTRPGNKDIIGAMFELEEHRYNSGDVSWSISGGTYYLHRKLR